MSEENKALMRHFIEDILNAGEYDRIDEVVAPEHTAHPLGQRGPEGYRQTHELLRAAFPDLHIAIDEMIAEGDIVALYMTWSGTHKGIFRGIAPSGNKLAWAHMQFKWIKDGMLVET